MSYELFGFRAPTVDKEGRSIPVLSQRFPLPFSADQAQVRVGRNPPGGGVALGEADPYVSAHHVTVEVHGGNLRVTPESSKNPPLFKGVQQKAPFEVKLNEQFELGRTALTFRREGTLMISREPTTLTSAVLSLADVPYRNPQHYLSALEKLPRIIESAPDEADLARMVLVVLAEGLQTNRVAIVQCPDSAADEVPVTGTQAEGPFRPSPKVVREALWDKKTGVLRELPPDGSVAGLDGHGDLAWVCCVPLPPPNDLTGLYVGGPRGGHSPDIQSGIKFTELVAKIYGEFVQALRLKSSVRELFPKNVQRILLSPAGAKKLLPQTAPITSLFCDLQNFTALLERHKDQLDTFWPRLSQALHSMASGITNRGGTVGDFQGDGVMGFWGWLETTTPEGEARNACQAALDIRSNFRQAYSAEPRLDCGVGLASGVGLAGKLGSFQMFKITVLGHAVNMAARLEALTRVFRVPILLDEATRELAKEAEGRYRFRRVARVQPLHVTDVVSVHQLLPPGDEELNPAGCGHYEKALAHFEGGDWKQARDTLDWVPMNDGPKQFLCDFMKRHGGRPPDGWNGVIAFTAKVV